MILLVNGRDLGGLWPEGTGSHKAVGLGKILVRVPVVGALLEE